MILLFFFLFFTSSQIDIIQKSFIGERYTINYSNNFNFQYCLFQQCHPNSNGGGLYIENSNFNISLYRCLFFDCSSYSSGGGFLISGNSIKYHFCCSVNCGIRHLFATAFNWGHGGIILATNLIDLSNINIYKCCPNSDYLGHIGFALCFGNQNVNNLNYSNNLAINIHSSFYLTFGDFLKISFSNFNNNIGYDSLSFGHHYTNLGISEYCNLINNTSTLGAYRLQNISTNSYNLIFYKNLKDFAKTLLADKINLFNCKTDKNNFDIALTNIQCEIYITNQINQINFLLKHLNCNQHFTKQKNILNFNSIYIIGFQNIVTFFTM